jgi:hypothetical protein
VTKTEWFPDDVKPVHDGLYETRVDGSLFFESAWSVCKGGVWHWASCEEEIPECIARAERGEVSYWQDREWRGLTELKA